jgi:hypothetical protein
VKVGKLATRRRRIAAVAVAGIVLATGTGVASAYFAPGLSDLATPEGFFTFCADRQRDIAGITDADLAGHPAPPAGTGPPTSAVFGIDNYVHDEPGPLVGSGLSASDPFVLGKSGIQVVGDTRRVLTTQRVEYADAARTIPVQIRCKMRTRESLVRPESEKQRFDNGTSSSVPWGFGPQTATGTQKTCRQVQEQLVSDVWLALLPEQQAASPYQLGSSIVLGPDTYYEQGNEWTGGEKIVKVANGTLTISDRSLLAVSGTPNPIGDRVTGAHYCTFVVPSYLRSVLLGGTVY